MLPRSISRFDTLCPLGYNRAHGGLVRWWGTHLVIGCCLLVGGVGYGDLFWLSPLWTAI